MRLLPQPERLDLGDAVPIMPVRRSLRGYIVLGLAAIFAAWGGFGFWAATAPLASAVVASGNLMVATKRKEVQHLEGGIVHRIAVKDGDRVAAGDVVIELDVTRAKSRFAMARMGYFAAAAAKARLSAERDSEPKFEFPSEISSASKMDPQVAAVLRSQRQIFTARRLEYLGQAEILNQRMKRLEDQIKGLEAQRDAEEQQHKYAIEEVATLEDLYARNLTTRQRVLAVRREAVRCKGQIGRLTSNIAAAKKEVGETELNLVQLKKRRNTEVLAELKDVLSKALSFRQQYLAYGNELERTMVRAPVSGTVVGLQVHTIGGVVRGGETLLEIVPERDHLVVEVKVRPTDVDDITLGQSTQVRFNAFKQRTTPTLKGHVALISADVLSEPRIPEPYYAVSIEVDTSELSRLGEVKLQPGMPADVMIETGHRTALAYLIQPIAETINRAWREQ